MIEWIKQNDELDPIIFDNNSTYPHLLDWYNTNPCQILRVPFNSGHYGIFQTGIIEQVRTQYYIIADPDFDMSSVPLDVIEKMKIGLSRYPNYGKCGLSIRIDDLPDGFPGKQDIIQWEDKYWKEPLDDLFYKADVDTTFALYDSSRLRHYTYDAIRIAPPYVARHIPWYLTKDNISDEFKYYCAHNEGSANICGYCRSII